MVQRYSVTSTVAPSTAGDYVSFADYEKLVELLKEALADAQNYFEMLGRGWNHIPTAPRIA
jgi:outer membrane protein TolC